MDEQVTNILIVDDEPKNLRILKEYMEDLGYQSVEAVDGAEAWSILQQSKNKFDAILLDRMMPKMDGMEVLKRIKGHPDLRFIPVIMQTAANAESDILEGIQAGCYYYLTKPFEEEMITSIVRTAVTDHRSYRSMQGVIRQQNLGLTLLDSASFRIRTLNEAEALAQLLSMACPAPDVVVVGFLELLVNAVEHGNLGIGYATKSQLLESQEWNDEIERRLSLPEFASRYVTVQLDRKESDISCVIKDEGVGFDWEQYLEFSSDRVTDSHGRGIAMANVCSFDNIEYRGSGSEVKVTLLTHP